MPRRSRFANTEPIKGRSAGRPVSVERETFPGLLAAGATVLGVVDEAYWLDLGTPLAFVKGSAELVQGLISDSSRARFVEVVERLVVRGAEGIIADRSSFVFDESSGVVSVTFVVDLDPFWTEQHRNLHVARPAHYAFAPV